MDNNRRIEQFNVLYIIIRSVHYELHCSLSLSLSFLRSVVVQNSYVLFVEEKKNSFAQYIKIPMFNHLASSGYTEPVSKHMEEQGLDFLQFAFRWFNCLMIREVSVVKACCLDVIYILLLICLISLQIPFHLVTRLWDTYLAEGDYLPDFLVYISASFLLTVS